MGRGARPRDQAGAGGRRSRHRRDLLPALARHIGAAGCRQRRSVAGNARALSRRLGPRGRSHTAWLADPTKAGRLSHAILIGLSRWRSHSPSFQTQLNKPNMTPSRDISALIAIMAQLRTPVTGCPWDLEQNFATIAPYTIEEAYEVADAIARGDLDDLKDELGDLLLQVVFHARMAEESGAFDFGDVVEAITRKMIRRHPHVFADKDGKLTPSDVKGAWDRIKAEEKAERAARRSQRQQDHKSLLANVKTGQPALARAIELQRKASTVGFDWNDPRAVLRKIRE